MRLRRQRAGQALAEVMIEDVAPPVGGRATVRLSGLMTEAAASAEPVLTVDDGLRTHRFSPLPHADLPSPNGRWHAAYSIPSVLAELEDAGFGCELDGESLRLVRPGADTLPSSPAARAQELELRARRAAISAQEEAKRAGEARESLAEARAQLHLAEAARERAETDMRDLRSAVVLARQREEGAGRVLAETQTELARVRADVGETAEAHRGLLAAQAQRAGQAERETVEAERRAAEAEQALAVAEAARKRAERRAGDQHARHEAELAEAVAVAEERLREALAAEHLAVQEALRDEHDAALDERQAAHADELAALRSAHGEDLDALRGDHARELDDLRAAAQAALRDARALQEREQFALERAQAAELGAVELERLLEEAMTRVAVLEHGAVPELRAGSAAAAPVPVPPAPPAEPVDVVEAEPVDPEAVDEPAAWDERLVAELVVEEEVLEGDVEIVDAPDDEWEVVEPDVVEHTPAEAAAPAVAPLAVPDQAIDEEGNLVGRTETATTGTELLRVERRGLTRFKARERELGEDRDPAVTWLPRAIRHLAVTDPKLAARIIVQLLPAQALTVPGRLVYDLTIPELGSFRVSLVGGRGIAVPLAAPGSKVSSDVDFHLRASAHALAELALGASPKRMLLAGRIRIRGRRRRARALRGFAGRPPSLTEIARAGVRLDPWLLYTALATAIEPEWTAGHHFVLRHDITGTGGSTVHLIVRDGERIMVTRTEPGEPPVATVKTSVRAFHAGLAGQPAPAGEQVGVGGDLVAVGALKRWTEWAQSGGPEVTPPDTPAADDAQADG